MKEMFQKEHQTEKVFKSHKNGNMMVPGKMESFMIMEKGYGLDILKLF